MTVVDRPAPTRSRSTPPPLTGRGWEKRSVLAGTLAVALVLAGTRWASYVGYSPVFLTDLLLLAAAVNHFVAGRIHPERFPLSPHRPAAPLTLVLITGWAVIRFVGAGNFSVEAIRDAAPYLYCVVGVLSWAAMRRATPETRARTFRILYGALVFHAVWYAAQLVFPALPGALPLLSAAQGVHMFTARPDVDCALLGVLAALLLWRLMHGATHRFWLAIAYVGCLGMVATSLTRAGLLGALVANLYVILATVHEGERSSLRKAQILVTLPLAALIALVGLSFTGVGTKFLATLDPTATSSTWVAEGAEGTTRARTNAWNKLSEWVFEDTGRAVVGVGYGSNFLADSGANRLLVDDGGEGGDLQPRSPHNYWLGTLARTGLVGLALVAASIVQLLRRSWRFRGSETSDPLLLLQVLIPLSLLVPATLGVVLEAPFGAVPFWWSVGAVLATPLAGIPDPRWARGRQLPRKAGPQ